MREERSAGELISAALRELSIVVIVLAGWTAAIGLLGIEGSDDPAHGYYVALRVGAIALGAGLIAFLVFATIAPSRSPPKQRRRAYQAEASPDPRAGPS